MPQLERVSEKLAATVLVVEDEVLIRLLISDELRDTGLTVVEAGNASEALSYLASDPSVALVFTDVNMPGEMDGLALARQIARDYPAVKILVTSGHLHPTEGVQNIPLITKPYNLRDTVTRITDAIELPGDDSIQDAR
ncbi:hypothetical protein BH09PSE3_BH09PSE3_28110 [soil metagenome]